MTNTPKTDDALFPKNYGAYLDGSGDGVTAQECVFEQLVTLCRHLERENARLELDNKALAIAMADLKTKDAGLRFLDEAFNSGDGVYRP